MCKIKPKIGDGCHVLLAGGSSIAIEELKYIGDDFLVGLRKGKERVISVINIIGYGPLFVSVENSVVDTIKAFSVSVPFCGYHPIDTETATNIYKKLAESFDITFKAE